MDGEGKAGDILRYAQSEYYPTITAVRDIGFWNGYIVYDMVPDEPVDIGPPTFLLWTPESMRLTDPDEGMRVLDELILA